MHVSLPHSLLVCMMTDWVPSIRQNHGSRVHPGTRRYGRTCMLASFRSFLATYSRKSFFLLTRNRVWDDMDPALGNMLSSSGLPLMFLYVVSQCLTVLDRTRAHDCLLWIKLASDLSALPQAY